MAELTGYQIDLERRPRGHASLADLTRTLEVLEQRLDRVSQTRQEKRRSRAAKRRRQAAAPFALLRRKHRQAGRRTKPRRLSRADVVRRASTTRFPKS